MYKSGLFAIGFLLAMQLSAQLPSGSMAPDFTATDINGTSWNLYDILDEGKIVVLEISATWCPPCWAYHNSHAMQEFYEAHGPNGDNTAQVLFVEGDPSTNINCLYGQSGCSDYSPGNWVQGTPYPIFNNNQIANLYQISYFPTIFIICPNRKVYEVQQLNASDLWDAVQTCPVAYGTHNAGIFDHYKGTPFDEVCADDELTPRFNLVNLGSAILNQAEIELRWNNQLVETYNWTGYLSTYQEQEIVFQPLAISEPGTLKTSITQINGGTDEDPSNNNQLDQLVTAPSFNSQQVLLKVRTDNYGAESYWELRDEIGQVLDFGGNQNVGPTGGGQFPGGISSGPGAYGDNVLIKDTLELPFGGCYSFHMVDAYGDGMCCGYGHGYYKLYNLDNPVNPIMQGGEFTAYDEHAFFAMGITSVSIGGQVVGYKLYPNPSHGSVFLEIDLPESVRFSGTVYNTLGIPVYLIDEQVGIPGKNVLQLPSENWPNGMYILQLRTGETQKAIQFQVLR
jgi:thiol-disulfide isomerase/thioredoxin